MTKKIIIPLIIVTIAGVVFFLASNSNQSNIKYTTQTVKRGILKQTVDATGNIESAEKIDLNFKTTGRLAKLNVKAGDKVATGDILAKLETQALQSRVTDARAALDQAQANHQELLAGARAADIQVTANTVNQKKQALQAAQNDLTNLLTTKNTELTNLKDTAITNIKNELITAQRGLDEISDVINDYSIEPNLPAKDSNLLYTTQQNQATAQAKLDAIKLSSNTLNSNSADLSVENNLNSTKEMLEITADALSGILNTLEATLSSVSLSESTLDTLKDNVRAQQIKINTSLNTIQTSKSNWTNRIAYFNDQETLHEDAVKDATNALEIAESQLKLKKSPPRQFEIDASQAEINRAQASLNLALANLNDAIIRAPLNGTITKKNYNVGEQTSPSLPVLEMIGESKLQIEVNIPESDITKVNNGQTVEVTLDAFGDDEIFAGNIIFVDPAETDIQDVVYYKVKVELSDENPLIKPGMTANVVINSKTKDDVLSVPNRAIKDDGQKYVEILVNDQPIRRDITTGLRGDQDTEILTGLKEGDQVITFIKDK